MATIDIATLATTLDASPREVRKFLRSVTPDDAQPGKGGRWAIEKRDVRSLTKKFAEYRASKEVPNDDEPEESTVEETSDAE